MVSNLTGFSQDQAKITCRRNNATLPRASGSVPQCIRDNLGRLASAKKKHLHFWLSTPDEVWAIDHTYSENSHQKAYSKKVLLVACEIGKLPVDFFSTALFRSIRYVIIIIITSSLPKARGNQRFWHVHYQKCTSPCHLYILLKTKIIITGLLATVQGSNCQV